MYLRLPRKCVGDILELSKEFLGIHSYTMILGKIIKYLKSPTLENISTENRRSSRFTKKKITFRFFSS